MMQQLSMHDLLLSSAMHRSSQRKDVAVVTTDLVNQTTKALDDDSTNCLGQNYTPGPHDVICARGKKAYHHTGNQRFRDIIRSRMPDYSRAKTKLDKSLIVTEIIYAVQCRDGGRFVRMDRNQAWFQVSDNAAREKVGQGFRDMLPTKYKSSTKKVKSAKAATASSSGLATPPANEPLMMTALTELPTTAASSVYTPPSLMDCDMSAFEPSPLPLAPLPPPPSLPPMVQHHFTATNTCHISNNRKRARVEAPTFTTTPNQAIQVSDPSLEKVTEELDDATLEHIFLQANMDCLRRIKATNNPSAAFSLQFPVDVMTHFRANQWC